MSWFVPTKVFTPVPTYGVSVRNCRVGSWSRVQSKSASLFNFRGPCPTDKIKGLWDPKRTSASPKTSWNWMRIIHHAQTAVLFVWALSALSFCKVWIERSGLLRSWSRVLSDNIISTRKEPLNFCWKFIACFTGVKALAFKAACGLLMFKMK